MNFVVVAARAWPAGHDARGTIVASTSATAAVASGGSERTVNVELERATFGTRGHRLFILEYALLAK